MRGVFKNYQGGGVYVFIKGRIYQDIKVRINLGISRLSLV